jgi:hypothetical protein
MKQAPIKIDSTILSQAKNKAKENNIPGGMTGLFSYLLDRAINDNIRLNVNYFNWKCDKDTSIYRDHFKVSHFQDMLLKNHGINANSLSFVVNFLFYNYINHN